MQLPWAPFEALKPVEQVPVESPVPVAQVGRVSPDPFLQAPLTLGVLPFNAMRTGFSNFIK
jgi:hypothetical protein